MSPGAPRVLVRRLDSCLRLSQPITQGSACLEVVKLSERTSRCAVTAIESLEHQCMFGLAPTHMLRDAVPVVCAAAPGIRTSVDLPQIIANLGHGNS